jgi:cytochrome c oxidase subunit 2
VKIDYYEKIFLILGVVLLLSGLGAILVSVVGAGAMVPTPAGRVAPADVRTTPPFDNPGVREIEPGKYEAVIIAQIWSFVPNEIQVPAGSEVTFRVTSADVIHGFFIENTQVNAMVIPGQITEVTQKFDEAGEYLLICHEYCGIGHHNMWGRVVVTE